MLFYFLGYPVPCVGTAVHCNCTYVTFAVANTLLIMDGMCCHGNHWLDGYFNPNQKNYVITCHSL